MRLRPLHMIATLLLPLSPARGQDAPPPLAFFGAPVIRYTSLRDQGALMAGGRGGWYVTPALAIGFGLHGTVTEVDAPPEIMPALPYTLDVAVETFAVDFEYVPRPAARTRATVGASLGGAAGHYMKNGTSVQEGETDFMLLFEPAVGVERALARTVWLYLSASYRLLRGVEMLGLTTADLAGPSAAIAVKFGR